MIVLTIFLDFCHNSVLSRPSSLRSFQLNLEPDVVSANLSFDKSGRALPLVVAAMEKRRQQASAQSTKCGRIVTCIFQFKANPSLSLFFWGQQFVCLVECVRACERVCECVRVHARACMTEKCYHYHACQQHSPSFITWAQRLQIQETRHFPLALFCIIKASVRSTNASVMVHGCVRKLLACYLGIDVQEDVIDWGSQFNYVGARKRLEGNRWHGFGILMRSTQKSCIICNI